MAGGVLVANALCLLIMAAKTAKKSYYGSPYVD